MFHNIAFSFNSNLQWVAKLSQFYLKLKFLHFIHYVLKLSSVLRQCRTPVRPPSCLAWPAEAASSCPLWPWPPMLCTRWSWGVFAKQSSMSVTCVKPSSDFSLPSELLPKELKARPQKESSRPCKRKSLPLSGIYSYCPASPPSILQTHTPLTASQNFFLFLSSAMLSWRQAFRVCLMSRMLFPPLLLHFCLANSCFFPFFLT